MSAGEPVGPRVGTSVGARVGTVGIVANPASGKDIRRLVAHAVVTSNAEKSSMIVRALAGMAEAGVARVRYLPDHGDIAASAVDALRRELAGLDVAPLDLGLLLRNASDTTAAARALRDADVGAVLSIGGDGTNRAITLGWPDVPLVAVSTGTNNAFPRLLEPTLAGLAAGLVASARVPLSEVAAPAKTVHIDIEGERDDLALIDAVLVDADFVGSRALADPAALREVVLTRSDPAAMGICGLGGQVALVAATDDHGLALRLHRAPGSGAGARSVRAPFAPGRFDTVHTDAVRRLTLGEVVEWAGPGLLAFDGERERRLQPGQRAWLHLRRDGPRVIDVAATLRAAAADGR